MQPDNDRRRQARDTGMAATLILILVAYFGRRPEWLPAAAAVLLLTMVWPGVFGPLARLWFGLSHLLGTVVSRVILSLLFFVVVVPVGVLRRATGADPMALRDWRRDGSAFRTRDHRFAAADLERPF